MVGRSIVSPPSARASAPAARSSSRSAGSSRPTDRRIVPCVMPAAASSSSGTRKCVVEAGWITSDLASPTLARCENTRSASTKARPAARAALEVEAEHRAAAARQQALRQRVVGMRLQFRVGDRFDGRVRSQELHDRARVVDVALPCAAAGSRCPAAAGRRYAGSCRRRSRAGPRAARAAGRRDRAFLGEVHAVEAVVGLGQRRKFAAGQPVEGAAVDQHAADRDAVAAEELGGGVVDEVGAVIERASSARAW